MNCEDCGIEIDSTLTWIDGSEKEVCEKCARSEMGAIEDDCDREMGIHY